MRLRLRAFVHNVGELGIDIICLLTMSSVCERTTDTDLLVYLQI